MRRSVWFGALLLANASCVARGAEVDSSKLSWAQLVERMATRAYSGEEDTCRTAVIRGSILRAVPQIREVRIYDTYLLIKVERVLKQFDLDNLHDDHFEENNKENFVEWPKLKAGQVVCVALPSHVRIQDIGKHVTDLVIPLTGGKNRFRVLADRAALAKTIDNGDTHAKAAEPPKLDSDEMKSEIANNGLQAIPVDIAWFELIDCSLMRENKTQWDAFFSRVEIEAELIGLLADEDDQIAERVTEKYKPTDDGVLSRLRQHPSVTVRESVANLLLENGDPTGFPIYAELFSTVLVELTSDVYSLPDYGAPATRTLDWHDERVRVYQMKLPMILGDLKKHLKIPLLDSANIDMKELDKWLRKEKHPDLIFDKEAKVFRSK